MRHNFRNVLIYFQAAMVTLIHVPAANSRMKDDFFFFFLFFQILDEVLSMANLSDVEHGSQPKAGYI